MELQTNPTIKMRTPRVKSISGDSKTNEVLICLFTGEVQLYNIDTLQLTRSSQVSTVPIRTGVIVKSNDWILVGTDEGSILVLDLGNLAVINKVQAHDDFIRKIVLDDNNKRFITVSDDNTAKLWSYNNDISLIHCYKDSKHFVMDACFCPSDHNLFFTVSLDCKVRMYSVQYEKVIRKFKGHEKGINCIAFISSDIFVTGSDDSSIIVWDYKKTAPITVLKGHSGNVNHLYSLGKGFASSSEDNTVKIWDESFKPINVKTTAGRAWCVYEKNSKVFIGADDELCVYLEEKIEKIAAFSENKIFFNEGNLLKYTKPEEIRSIKEVGAVTPGFKDLKLSPNGKYLTVIYDDKFEIFSTLGLRKKFEEKGKCFNFIENDLFIFQDSESIKVFNKFELEKSIKIENLNSLLLIDESIIVLNKDKTCIYDKSTLFEGEDALLHEFDLLADKAIILGDFLILCNDKINFFNSEFKNIATVDKKVCSYFVSKDILFFSTENMTFYCFIANELVYIYPMKFLENIVGVKDDIIVYISDKLDTFNIDYEFYSFQMAVLRGEEATVSDSNVDKAISFYESLEMHQKALSLCKDDNQKFEILLKLNNLEEAFKMANSPIKYKKLGKAFLKKGDFSKSSDCFYKANDLNNLLIVDVFGDRKYLSEIGDKAQMYGTKNLAFLAYYKAGEYEKCKGLLKSTPFYNLFDKFYCSE